jgi:hypothetical protein
MCIRSPGIVLSVAAFFCPTPMLFSFQFEASVPKPTLLVRPVLLGLTEVSVPALIARVRFVFPTLLTLMYYMQVFISRSCWYFAEIAPASYFSLPLVTIYSYKGFSTSDIMYVHFIFIFLHGTLCTYMFDYYS